MVHGKSVTSEISQENTKIVIIWHVPGAGFGFLFHKVLLFSLPLA